MVSLSSPEHHSTVVVVRSSSRPSARYSYFLLYIVAESRTSVTMTLLIASSSFAFSQNLTWSTMGVTILLQLCLLVSFLLLPIQGFVQSVTTIRGSLTTRLFGIHEWRDVFFDLPGSGNDRRLGVEDSAPPREICILPFPYTDVLLQGETKQLRLYEDRFIKLFDDCMENHGGLVAMGLLADSGIIQTVPLCEIEAYNRMEGFGIFVTIRAVGRANLLEVTKQEPYLKAVCIEVADNFPPNLELPNLLASGIDNLMLQISSMEHRLNKAREKEEVEEDEDMQRRINIAKLVSKGTCTAVRSFARREVHGS